MNAEEKPKKFSFIIPVYNAGRHLECCLRSIRYQDYQQGEVEVIAVDGGSSDDTQGIARSFACKVLDNPRKLAEYGVQAGIKEAAGEFLVIFAADNELVGKDWLKRVADIFHSDPDVSAVWGRLASGENDPPLNKYFELIQSDPLNWFLNKNLKVYIKTSKSGKDYSVFTVNPARPLVWGANGLVYRANKIKAIWKQEGYLGDNDAFQYMLEEGDNKVAYFDSPFVYHHHVARLTDWIKKWRRNFSQHLSDKQKTRNMNWVFTGNFNKKLLLWSIYSAIPIPALIHSLYLCLKSRNLYWLYHSPASCAQFWTYAVLALTTSKGRNFISKLFIQKGSQT